VESLKTSEEKEFGGKCNLAGSNVIFPRFIPTNYGAEVKLEDLP
jgi:hypothetical protein